MTTELTSGNHRGFRLTLALALALAPALAAVWWFPWFVTQDGPAHLYNAQILAESRNPDSPFQAYYSVRRQPLPNWAGHVLTMGLVSTLPLDAADRALTTITLVGLAAATAWLGFRVTEGRGIIATAVLAALLGLNVTWLFGFTGFLLGAALFPVTLGVWWGGRERMSARRALAIAGLIVLGYFCHPVSLGLTAIGLIVLATLTPSVGRVERSATHRRAASSLGGLRFASPTLLWTIVSLLPLIPLGLIYRGLTRSGGPMRPEWAHLTDPLSVRSWAAQLGWVDPISLASKVDRPFGSQTALANALFAPVLWSAVALIALSVASLAYRDRARRGWGVLAGLLLLAGLVGPDTLGTSHGHYLSQRIVLLGLVALVPWLRLEGPGRLARLGRAGLVVALILQSLFVWDYGRESQRTVGRLMASGELVGRNQRVAAVWLDIRGRFRANPLLHADCLLGIGTGNILWGDYETTHYYFPVQLRNPDMSPPAAGLEAIARLEGEMNARERAEMWSDYLKRYESSIDVVLIWGHDPAIESITSIRFVLMDLPGDGRVQVWRSNR